MKTQDDGTEQLQALKRIELLLEVIAKASLAEKIAAVSKDRQLRLLYEHTGQIPIRQLSKRTRFSTGTISGLWKRWEQDGLLIKEGKSYRKVF